MMKAMIPLVCLSASLVLSGAALGQEMSIGHFEYSTSCAACHGQSVNGDGPIADFFTELRVPDLTVIQKNNGGVFPVSAVHEVIDGSAVANAHGTREMPLWGNRFRDRIDAAQDPHFAPEGREAHARTRVLAPVGYLASIQEQ